MHRIYWGAPLVQETCFWCTKWTKRCRWYRKRASGVPTRTRHQCRASGRKLWQNSRWHSWFTFINFGAWHCQFRSKRLLFRVKKWWLYTRRDNPDWSRVRKATFFTRCISPGSSATPCLIWQRWRLGPLHTGSCAGLSAMHNCLNISIIREILANSYIVPFVFSSTGAISSVCAPMAEMNCLELDRAQSIKQDNAGGDHFSGSHRHFVLLMLPSDIHSFMNII